MNEGIVEGGKDTGDTENELAYKSSQIRHGLDRKFCRVHWVVHTISGQRTERDVLLGSTGGLLGSHFVDLLG